MSENPSPTIFDVLAQEHRGIEAQFAHVHDLGATDIDEARREYDRLAGQLLAHLSAEVEVVYPRLVRLDELCDDIAMAVGDYERLAREIGDLRIIRITPGEWIRAVRRLELEIEQHFDLAECEMFPVAKLAISETEALALAHAFVDFAH